MLIGSMLPPDYWRTFWQEYPEHAESNAYLKQVGKTVSGVPITEKQLQTLIRTVKEGLQLQEEDRVLDLCCGNGIITQAIAKGCDFVLGIDFSRPLIEVAKKQHFHENIRYVQMDARRIGELADEYRSSFTKTLWYEALGFFNRNEFESVLKAILELSTPDPIIFVGSILDRARIWNFFNTFRRKWFYITRILLLRQEVGLGRWWRASEIERICWAQGLETRVQYQDSSLHTAHYRFDMTISRKGTDD